MVTDEDIQEMKDMYRSAEYSKKEIAEKFKMTPYYISKYLGETKPDMLGKIRKEFKEAGYTLLSEEYINSKTPLRYLCPKHGEHTISWNSFQKGYRCPKCSKEKQRLLMYKKIKETFKKEGYTLLSEKYIGVHEPLKYLCPKHGEQVILWSVFQQGHRCVKCNDEKRRQSIYKEIKKAFKEVGYTLLSEEYISAIEPLRYKCSKHGEYTLSWSRFQSGHVCPGCNDKRRRQSLYEEIKAEFKNVGYTLLSEEYINNKTPLKYLCQDMESKLLYGEILIMEIDVLSVFMKDKKADIILHQQKEINRNG